MADVFSKAKRSEVMSRIRSRGNRDTELAFAKLLRANHITGWRRHFQIRGRAVLPRGPKNQAAQQRRPTNNQRTARRSVPAFRVKPDFVFRQVRLALFVDGCFWHGCPKHCKYAKWLMRYMAANNPASPKSGLRRTGRAFWLRKLAGNKKRDVLVTRTLRRAGWRVIRIWECDLRNAERILKRIEKHLK